jgi:hypothetical protein
VKMRMTKFGSVGVVAALAVAVLTPPAQAQDFFSNLFGGFGRSRAPVIQMPLGDNIQQVEPRQRVGGTQSYGGGGQAYCVRTCDGRAFPVSGSDTQSRISSCSSLCPSAETKVMYGSSIDNASTDNGKAYSSLPNAFRYRNELVAGCTCNGKDAMGLAQVSIENDPTLRKGDIVAGKDGLMSVSRPDRRGASLNFTPAPERIRAKYERAPVLARE